MEQQLTDNQKIILTIEGLIRLKGATYDRLKDMRDVCLYCIENEPESREFCFKKTKLIKTCCIKMDIAHPDGRLYELYCDILMMEAPYLFESFILYMEKDRPFEKRFYEPRKETLQIVVNDLQELEDGKFKFYGLSMPSRVGKSTTCIFFLAWIMYKRPNSHNAMGGHSGILAKGFHKEVMNLITTPEYNFGKLYSNLHPGHEMLRDKSAEEFTITLDAPDRFATLTCRGIDGTWTGAVDISQDGYLYVDDLVRDREMSLSPMRMDNCYNEYLNKMVDRKSGEGCRELMVGTLWNVYDPLERVRQQFEGNPNYRFRRIPALNDNDESNFDYVVNGFSTAFYREMRTKLAEADWMAKYQQQPFVREGLLFPKEELHYFDGFLPEGKGDFIALCDPAVGGGDNLSMPVFFHSKENGKFYVVDWVFSNATQKFTVPRITDAISRHHITTLHIERNGVGLMIVEAIKADLKSKGIIHCKIETYSAPNKISKEEKIKGYSDYAKEHFYFLIENRFRADEGDEIPDDLYQRGEDYNRAMSELCMYSTEGKNVHDDAADSIAQFARINEVSGNGAIEVVKNPFATWG